MIHFWDRVTAPVIDALRPRTILQIGAKDEHATRKLIEAAIRIGATVHVAALDPAFDVAAARRDAGDRLVVHPARGRDVVPLLATPELILIDDDPNWYNVHGLLTAVERQARGGNRPFPTVLVTQTGWPYGRRDSYDEPSAIPEHFRQAYERAGIVPGSSTLSAQHGIFCDRFNAAAENEAQSGVLTALEDFLGDRPGLFAMSHLPMFHGLTLLRPTGGPAEPALQSILSILALGRSAMALAVELEAARVALEIDGIALRQALVQATYRNDALHQALRAEQSAAPSEEAGEARAAALAHALLRRLRRAAAARLRNLATTGAS
ncbi:MAG TPA: hypothetical protein VGV37_24010 [Aliidongia sp.]|uniref:hypothetical protein n=1 Tax=Aliidongia sp. TaxID=1914230 RepID=UPI002DDDA32D|nr:hypothetical protein [Aliidongia sp.]HEV2677617.1 hypothetical protein [Aliidongia sp.]